MTEAVDYVELHDPVDDLPPNSVELEAGLLSAVFQWPELMHQLAEQVKPEHFYQPPHQLLYQTYLEIHQDDLPVEPVAVREYLNDANRLFDVGGITYANELAMRLINTDIRPESIQYFVNRLLDYACRRALIAQSFDINLVARDMKSKSYLQTAEKAVIDVSNSYQHQTVDTAKTMLDGALESIQKGLDNPSGLLGLSTGFRSLDEKSKGLQSGQLIIVGARSGVGKTAFGLNIATNLVMRHQKPVLFFSLEMTAAELMSRVLKSEAGTGTDIEKLRQTKELVKAQSDLFIVDDSVDTTILDIQSRTRKAMASMPELSMVVVDYIGKVKPESQGKGYQNRAYELEAITWGLKSLAKSLKIPVMALCQLNRAVEARNDKKPMLADLRDSGGIEQDADQVWLLSKKQGLSGMRTIDVAKNRNGPTGSFELAFIEHLTKFKILTGVSS